MTDRIAKARAAVDAELRPEPYFKKDPQRDRILGMLASFNEAQARQGYPPIPTTPTQEELELVAEFTDTERRLIGHGPPRASLTPPFIH